MMTTRKKLANASVRNMTMKLKANKQRKLSNEKDNNQLPKDLPDSITSEDAFIYEDKTQLNQTEVPITTTEDDHENHNDNDEDTYINENVKEIFKQEDWNHSSKDAMNDTTNQKYTYHLFQRRKGNKYCKLLPAEVGNITRYVRKELFFRMKFVTNSMFDKFKIVDLCFHQINLTNPEDKRTKEQTVIKVVKDALNSRRGYASQLLTEKLKGTNSFQLLLN
jgi:hypothetical protein